MMQPLDLSQLRAARHRRALVLAGARASGVQAAQALLAAAGWERVLWVSDAAPEGAWSMPAAQALEVLGRELEAVVFDAHAGLHLDALGAVAGTVRGGGLLLVLAPPLERWPAFADPDYVRITVSPYTPEDVTGRFLRRLVRVIGEDPDVLVLGEGETVAAGRIPVSGPADEVRCTEDQLQAVEAIVAAATGHRRRPVVLTSDRGRGKSAALGIAAARLLQRGMEHIVVTGPRPEAVEKVFEHAGRHLPGAQVSRAALHLGAARIEFQPPDLLAREAHPTQLLLVDEAAAIPTPLLECLLERYARIVFATTVHGYEGTGRGFAVRFQKVLDVRTPHWRALRLETPVRWAAGDPLERFVFRALLLDAAAAPDEAVRGASVDSVGIERLDRDALLADEVLLGELFGLLVLAHYRTRPFDLRLLLDGPNVSVYVMRHAGHVVGTALVAAEGGLDVETAWRVWAGHTRPHGHLLPETLAAHVGLERAPLLLCARVLRIAVHPAAQGRGLGTRLVADVVEQLRAEGLAYVGSSFGATEELLRFWARTGFVPVRFSVKRGAASGAHSALVLRPLSAAGGEVVAAARGRFLAELPHQLADPLRTLGPALAARLLLRTEAPAALPALDRHDWRDLAAFGFGGRIYEVCTAPLWTLACAVLGDPRTVQVLSRAQRDALVVKVLQKRGWREAAEVLGVSGRGGVLQLLRAAVQALVLHLGDSALHAEADRLSELWKRQ
jgi:tRNA(Met) cytidine acetyltransferase